MATKTYKIEYSESPDGGMCPPGFHFVRGHERKSQSGKITWVDAHMAKNAGGANSGYLSENLHHLFHTQVAKIKSSPIGKICNFPEYNEVDPLINFWLDYWKDKGLKFPEGMSPKIVKAIIAKESSFNPNARSKDKKSTATGLMQVTSTARNVLSGKPDKSGYRESRKENIKVTQDHLFDPLINVAVGIRWLSHKHSLQPQNKKDLFHTLRAYYDKSPAGDKYAKEVLELASGNCK